MTEPCPYVHRPDHYRSLYIAIQIANKAIGVSTNEEDCFVAKESTLRKGNYFCSPSFSQCTTTMKFGTKRII